MGAMWACVFLNSDSKEGWGLMLEFVQLVGWFCLASS